MKKLVTFLNINLKERRSLSQSLSWFFWSSEITLQIYRRSV